MSEINYIELLGGKKRRKRKIERKKPEKIKVRKKRKKIRFWETSFLEHAKAATQREGQTLLHVLKNPEMDKNLKEGGHIQKEKVTRTRKNKDDFCVEITGPHIVSSTSVYLVEQN